MKDLWDLDTSSEQVDDSLKFIKEQASLLAQKTDGLVKAVFQKARVSPLESITKTAQSFNKMLQSRTNSKDASELYKTSNYEFYITDKNNDYELELFEISCNSFYPIYWLINESVAKEANIESKLEMDDSTKLEITLSKILKTRKVVYVINKLICMLKDQRD